MIADLTLFAHVARRPDAEIDLALAALLIAEPEYPTLDVARYIDELDRLGAEARLRLDSAAPGRESGSLERILAMLYGELGLRGNGDDYYDPRNSFLNEVLDRKVGIPITLAIVTLEVAARAGVPAFGVSFPGHFLLRAPGSNGPQFFDPFDGRRLDRSALRELTSRATGEERDPDPRLLEPATRTQILMRMLNNLRGIYATREDRAREAAMVARMQILDGAASPRTKQ